MTPLHYAKKIAIVLGILISARLGEAERVSAQDRDGDGSGTVSSKVARAARHGGPPIRVDGALDEASWENAPRITDFVQKEPTEGGTPTDDVEVRILYDETAIYVGARLDESDPASIRAPIGRRDDAGQADYFLVSLDTYLDRRTAYTFGVTAGGVRFDRYHPSDDEDNYDEGYNPVWEASTQVGPGGWTAEIRIPLSQLRFNPSADQRWGLNFARAIPQREEVNYWVPVPRDVRGWASRFGTLEGIESVNPSRGVELLPYVASEARFIAEPDPANPFESARSGRARVGTDLKVGLGPNVTLDATVNPDFGQVEADPAVVNLSAFEVFFPERRPFFTEGNQLFSGTNLFYSRRIGGVRSVPIDADYVDAPETATILGAAKLTGRFDGGTSFGVLGAVTDRESATTWSEESGFGEAAIAPRTITGVVSAEHEFGPNASTVGLLLTGLRRDNENSAFRDYLHRDAFSTEVESNLRFKGGEYSLYASFGYTHVRGDSTAILRTQRSPVHFFQRPDQDHVTVDPSRTSLGGANGVVAFSRNSGAHWLGDVTFVMETPGFEPNDAGRLGNADEYGVFAGLVYRENTPGGWYRNYSVRVASENLWTFGGARQFGAIRGDASLTLPNFWRLRVTAWRDLASKSVAASRGGPLVGIGSAKVGILQLLSSSSSDTRWNGRVYFGEDSQGDRTMRLSGGVSVRPSSRWQFSIDPNYLITRTPRQYVTTEDGGPPATFGNRYIFAFTDRTTFVVPIRASYSVRPDLTLELYAEPFAASGRFYRHGELGAPGSESLRTYGEDGGEVTLNPDGSRTVDEGSDSFTISNRDFNVRSLRSNAVLRWEWRPGSTLFVVWQQDRFSAIRDGARVGVSDLWDAVSTPGEHRLLIKASYWLPVG